MPAIGFLSQKGGSGKSLLTWHTACALASTGGRCLVVDSDPQQSIAKLWQLREAEEPAVVTARADRIEAALSVADGRAVLVDTPPQVGNEIRAIARALSFLVIIARPAVFDLRAIIDTLHIARDVGKPACIVLNACPPARGTAEAAVTTEARKAVGLFGVPVCPVIIHQRVAYAHALTANRGITEFEPDGTAAAEIGKFTRWLVAQSSQ